MPCRDLKNKAPDLAKTPDIDQRFTLKHAGKILQPYYLPEDVHHILSLNQSRQLWSEPVNKQMSGLTFNTFFSFLICLAMVSHSEAQVVIKVRPPAPVVRVHPVRPGPRHIWIDGEYAWRGNQYVYTDGYWAVPPARYRYWKPGHWKARRDGWVWIPGHWRK